MSANGYSDRNTYTKEDQWYQMQRSSKFGKLKAVPLDHSGKMRSKYQSYAETLESGRKDNPYQNPGLNRVSVMIHNIPPQAKAKELWSFFDKENMILDIILPKRRDVNNFRIGFILVNTLYHVKRLITAYNGTSLMGHNLLIKLSNREHRSSSTTPAARYQANASQSSEQTSGIKNPSKRDMPTKKGNYTNIPEKILVQQPSHRTEQAMVNLDFKEELQRSLLGFTEEANWADMLQERLTSLDFYNIQVRGISHRKFLLTFADEDEVNNANMQELLKVFTSVKQVNYIDLVVPRIAWVWCDGLPILAWNKETWKKLVGDWGYLLTEHTKPLQNAMFQGLRLCVSTNKVDKIDETLKVMIEDKGFWIRMKELDSSQSFIESYQRKEMAAEDKEVSQCQEQNFDSSYEEGTYEHTSPNMDSSPTSKESEMVNDQSENTHISVNLQEDGYNQGGDILDSAVSSKKI